MPPALGGGGNAAGINRELIVRLQEAYRLSLEVLLLVSYCLLAKVVQVFTWMVLLPWWSWKRHLER